MAVSGSTVEILFVIVGSCKWKDVNEQCEEGAAPGLYLQEAVNPDLWAGAHKEGKSQL